jgi:ABC-2 type transport system permease protein
MIKSEARLLGRNPGVVVWAIVLPVAAAIVLAAIPGTRAPQDYFGGVSALQAYQPILVLFVLAILAVQALPDVLTRYREMGVLKRLRTTPVSPGLLLFAQLALMVAVSLICMVLIVVLPGIISGQWPQNLLAYLISYVLVAWAMLGLGMVISSLFRNAKVAAGFGTVLFFVLQFFAGLWVTRSSMPDWMRWISNLTPGGAGVQSLMDSAAGQWPNLGYWAVLLIWGLGCSAISVRLFKWE